ncbi:class I SAM-dependent methyltransferase, partial [Mangrovimonas sp. AS39]|uniref:methyltransferase domain-containing protein n=1 Tax=Mangrovimonas futianensis TaxID=2895523 RepID=UPI001E53B952
LMYKQKPVDQSVYNALWAEQNKFWIFGFDEKAKRRSEGLAPYLLMDSFNLWDSKKVLDAGCGYGYLCKFLQEYGADVTGLDYSDYFVSNKVHNN